MSSTSARVGLSLLVLSILSPAFAHAGAFYIADIGTQGLARGGAYVASPDSLLAMHYNPAGLSQLSGFHFEADLSLVDLDFTFQRSCPCVDPTIAGASGFDNMLNAQFAGHPASTNTPLAIPFIGVAYGFPFLDFTVGFAAYGPNAGKYKYGPPLSGLVTNPSFNRIAQTDPERYTALEATTLEANFQLTAAFQPFEHFRFGASGFVYQNGNTQTLDLWVNSATFANEPERADFDIPITLTFKRNFALNWGVGATYDINAGPGVLSIGSSFRGTRAIRADGTLDLSLPELLKSLGVSVTGRDITIELNTAPIARAGVQYAIPHLFKAEVATVFEGWSVYNRVVVKPKDINVTLSPTDMQMLGRIIQPRGWTDTWSLRVGGEINALEPLVGFMAGYFFEPSAIPSDRVDASRVDLNKHGFSAGVSTTFFGATLRLAAMYVLLQSTDVKNSQVQLTGPLMPPLGSNALFTTIGNGNYSGNYLIGSVSLSFALDPLLSR
jgi:long-chain fatty acid transport protein